MSAALAPSTTEAAVIDTVRTLVVSHRGAIKPHVEALSRACKAAETATDARAALLAWGDVALAMEALSEEAKTCRDKAREWLAWAMAEDTGATTLQSQSGTWSVKRKAALVEILDPAAVPDDLMTQPTPQPDKVAIGKMLRIRGATNWARLIEPTEWTVQFTGKKS